MTRAIAAAPVQKVIKVSEAIEANRAAQVQKVTKAIKVAKATRAIAVQKVIRAIKAAQAIKVLQDPYSHLLATSLLMARHKLQHVIRPDRSALHMQRLSKRFAQLQALAKHATAHSAAE